MKKSELDCCVDEIVEAYTDAVSVSRDGEDIEFNERLPERIKNRIKSCIEEYIAEFGKELQEKIDDANQHYRVT